MYKKKKDTFVKINKSEWNLDNLKLRLKELKKLTQVETEIADVWETLTWTN